MTADGVFIAVACVSLFVSGSLLGYLTGWVHGMREGCRLR